MPQLDLLTRFEAYLVEQKLQAGDRLPGEVELARHFGVSRGTIREIVTHLRLQGVVERRPHCGTVLARPDIGAIGRELAFQLRYLGCGREELKAARRMLELSLLPETVRCVTAAQVDALRARVDEMAALENDPAAADLADLAFHRTLLAIPGNRLLTVFAEIIGLLFDAEHRQVFRNAEAVRKSVTDHRALLAALTAHDAVAMTALMEKHLAPL